MVPHMSGSFAEWIRGLPARLTESFIVEAAKVGVGSGALATAIGYLAAPDRWPVWTFPAALAVGCSAALITRLVRNAPKDRESAARLRIRIQQIKGRPGSRTKEELDLSFDMPDEKPAELDVRVAAPWGGDISMRLNGTDGQASVVPVSPKPLNHVGKATGRARRPSAYRR
jgi:hypothetical protein